MAVKKFEKQSINLSALSNEEVLEMARKTLSKEELFYMVKFKELYPTGGFINAKSALETAKSNVLKKINVS